MTDWGSILEGLNDDSADDLLPVGTYDFRVKEATGKVASTGSDMIELVLTVQGGPHDDTWVWTNLVFPKVDSKPGHTRMFMRKMRALGFTVEYLTTNNPTPDQLAAQMVGRSVKGDVVHKTWEKQKKAEVKMLHPMVDDSAPAAPAVADVPQVPDVAPPVVAPVAAPVAPPVAPVAPVAVPEVPQVPEVPAAPAVAAPPVAPVAPPVEAPPVEAPATVPVAPDEAPF